MKFGVYNAILHDRSLPEAIKVIAGLGLTGIELNSGGFLPAVHIPTFDDILTSDGARDEFLGQFEGTGVEIGGLNCNGNPLHPDPVIGTKHAEDIRRSIRLANRLGQHRVVTMSGLPAGEPGGEAAQLDRERLELRRPGRARPSVERHREVLAGDRPRGGGSRTSRSPSSCTRRTSCSTRPASASLSSAPEPPTSGSSWMLRTCSGSGWTRWPWSRTSDRWCSTLPPRT